MKQINDIKIQEIILTGPYEDYIKVTYRILKDNKFSINVMFNDDSIVTFLVEVPEGFKLGEPYEKKSES